MSTLKQIKPMLATDGELPHGPGWLFEIKWDGRRCIAVVTDGQVRLFGRDGRNITVCFPEVVAQLRNGPDAVFDGELVVLDSKQVPSFERLQNHRMNVANPSPARVKLAPVTFIVFDLLALGDEPLINSPYRVRRAELDKLAKHVTISPWHADGRALQIAAFRLGHEGVVAKRDDSIYQPGRRSPDWVKVPFRASRDGVIGGWRTTGRRELGSLMMGAYNDTGELVYLGDVGTGFTDRALVHLLGLLKGFAQDDSPFAGDVDPEGAHWVSPVLVGEVKYRTITRDGKLRYAAWHGLRTDKSREEVTL